jgi:hypothetical protein
VRDIALIATSGSNVHPRFTAPPLLSLTIRSLFREEEPVIISYSTPQKRLLLPSYNAWRRHSARSRGGVMNVHKHRLHEPRTKGVSAPCRLNQTQQSVTQSKSSRRRYEKRDPVEERRDTEDTVSYTSLSHEMMNIPVSLSSSRNRIPDDYSQQCLCKQELCSSSSPSFCHACFIQHPMRLTFDGLTAFVPPVPTAPTFIPTGSGGERSMP